MPNRDDWKRSEPKPPEPEQRNDCGCGSGRHCILNQHFHLAPASMDVAYPRRFTLEDIRWMKRNTGEAPKIVSGPNPPHWSDK